MIKTLQTFAICFFFAALSACSDHGHSHDDGSHTHDEEAEHHDSLN